MNHAVRAPIAAILAAFAVASCSPSGEPDKEVPPVTSQVPPVTSQVPGAAKVPADPTTKVDEELGASLPDTLVGRWKVELPDAAVKAGAKGNEQLDAMGAMTMAFDGSSATFDVMGQSESRPYKVEAVSGKTLVIRTTDSSNKVLRVTFEARDLIKIKDDRQPIHLSGRRLK